MKRKLKDTSIYDRWKNDAELYRQLEIKKHGRELTKEEREESIQKRWKDLTNGKQVKEYKKKPVIVKAIQWTGKNNYEVEVFTGDKTSLSVNSIYRPQGHLPEDYNLYINTLEGTMKVNIGDYIIKGVQGEFYPCKEDIFLETYEILEE